MKDCTTCKYGYEDERLGIPMCHHPKRFLEDCIDFNMHEEKEIKESEKPVPNTLEEATEKHINEVLFKWSYDDEDGIEQYVHDAFIAGAKWQKEQMLEEAVEGTLGYGPHLQKPIVMLEQVPDIWDGGCKPVKIIVIKED